jgi:hypothetical protein
LESPQTAALLIGTQNLVALGFGIAPGRGILTTLLATGAAQEALFPVRCATVSDDPFTSAVLTQKNLNLYR